MGREQSKVEECGGKCRATSGCTHFTFLDGWCYKKSGSVSKSDAFAKKGVLCGILDGNAGPKKGQLVFSNDFNSFDDVSNNWNQETGGHGWGNNELQ